MTALLLTMAAGPYVIASFAILAPNLREHFDLSRADLGYLVTASFVVGALGAVVAGIVADQAPTRAAPLLLFGLAGGGILVFGIASSYVMLLAAAALIGMSQSLANPITNHSVMANVESRHQGLVLGIKQSGVHVSQLLAGLIVPAIAVSVGWRVAVLSSLWIVAVGVIFSSHLAHPAETTSGSIGAATKSRTATRGEVLPSSVRWLGLYALLTGVAVMGTNAYLALYAFEALQLSLQEAGVAVSVLGLVGVFGRIGWSWHAGRTGAEVATLLFLALLSFMGLLLLAVAEKIGIGSFWVAVPLMASGAAPATGVLMVATVRTSAPQHLGKASGKVTAGLFSGFMIGPMLFGLLADRTGGYSASWLAMALSCLLAAGTCLWVRWRATIEGDDSQVSFFDGRHD